MLYGSGKQPILRGGQMAATLLLQGERGRNAARKRKSRCEPPRCLHGVYPCASRFVTRLLPRGSWQWQPPVPVGLCKGGGLPRRVPPGRSRASCSPGSEPRGCRGQQALPSRWQESGHMKPRLPGTGTHGIQLFAAPSFFPAFREF